MAANDRYKPDLHPVMLDAHLKEGWSFYSFCGRAGVCNNTIQKWIHKHKEFRDVYLKNYGKKSIKILKQYSN
jgi:lambda repressor-like predicted transcriptional regulator